MNEIDELVAVRVVGWTVSNGSAYSPEGGRYADIPWNDENRPRWLPRYSTDIAAAWEVARHVISGRHVRFATLEGSHTQPFAEFFDVSTGHERFSACENTIELAICLAALRSVGVSEEEIGKALEETK